jgi:signal peptidase II
VSRPFRLAEALIVASVVILDQITKAWLQSSLELHEYRPVVDGLLSISHVRNRGAAFGILSDAGLPYQGAVLSVVSLLALVAIAVYAWRLPPAARLPRLALAFVLGGALGNLIDRVRYGYVVDFIHVYWNQHAWPDFNLADSAITTGVCLLVLDMLRSERRAEPQPEPATGRTD